MILDIAIVHFKEFFSFRHLMCPAAIFYNFFLFSSLNVGLIPILFLKQLANPHRRVQVLIKLIRIAFSSFIYLTLTFMFVYWNKKIKKVYALHYQATLAIYKSG